MTMRSVLERSVLPRIGCCLNGGCRRRIAATPTLLRSRARLVEP
jgi:hypothetical protein